jgi:hypothetical protein
MQNQSVTPNFTLPFSAQSVNGNITNVTVLLNDIVIGNYAYDLPIVEDAKSIKLNPSTVS